MFLCYSKVRSNDSAARVPNFLDGEKEEFICMPNLELCQGIADKKKTMGDHKANRLNQLMHAVVRSLLFWWPQTILCGGDWCPLSGKSSLWPSKTKHVKQFNTLQIYFELFPKNSL